MFDANDAPVRAVRDTAHRLTGAPADYDPLLAMVGDARLVLLGEATHGTREFYLARIAITQRLIMEQGFTGVVCEADWPDADRVNRYVRGVGEDRSAEEALGDFRRFPQWMWRNTDVRNFVAWLRDHNAALASGTPRVGFYGMDLYSLRRSREEVVRYLDQVDPDAARRARSRYACFDHHGEDPQEYGYAASFDLSPACEDQVVQQLVELQRRAAEYARRDGQMAADQYFTAEQNARLVRDAEEYYRSMFRGRVSSWNLRDRHMMDTVDALLTHLDRQVGRTRLVLWAHNSHLGDARATQMGEEGEWNVGQLARERHGGDAFLVGFTTYDGSVRAASDWGGEAERKRVRTGLSESHEEMFHEVGIPNFLLPLRGNETAAAHLREPRLERAIGVIYRPESERVSHYFHARLADQFDAVIHCDTTHALDPLESMAEEPTDQAPDTFPTAV